MVKNDCAHTTTEMTDYTHTFNHISFRTSKCIPTPTPQIGVNVSTSLSSPWKCVTAAICLNIKDNVNISSKKLTSKERITALSRLLCRGECLHRCNHSVEGSDHIFNHSAEGEGLHLGNLFPAYSGPLCSLQPTPAHPTHPTLSQPIPANFQPILAHSSHSSHSSLLQPLQPTPAAPAYSSHSSPLQPIPPISHHPNQFQPISSLFQSTLPTPAHLTHPTHPTPSHPHHPKLFPAYFSHSTHSNLFQPIPPIPHHPSPSQPISSPFQTTLLIPPLPTPS